MIKQQPLRACKPVYSCIPFSYHLSSHHSILLLVVPPAELHRCVFVNLLQCKVSKHIVTCLSQPYKEWPNLKCNMETMARLKTLGNNGTISFCKTAHKKQPRYSVRFALETTCIKLCCKELKRNMVLQDIIIVLQNCKISTIIFSISKISPVLYLGIFVHSAW